MRRIAVAASILFVPLAAFAGVVEVKMKLPVKPKLQITGDEKIAIAPFIIAATIWTAMKRPYRLTTAVSAKL